MIGNLVQCPRRGVGHGEKYSQVLVTGGEDKCGWTVRYGTCAPAPPGTSVLSEMEIISFSWGRRDLKRRMK